MIVTNKFSFKIGLISEYKLRHEDLTLGKYCF